VFDDTVARYSDPYLLGVPYAALAIAGAAVFGKSSTTLLAVDVDRSF